MPLPIRDGNQSLTTLSTLIVNSAHVPAHTVVSIGSQAITDIAQAVSGVELGPNTINALENISVTFGSGASVTIGNVVSVTGGLTNAELRASSVTIGGSVQVSNLPATQTVTFTQASVTFGQAVVSASNIGDILSGVGTDNTADTNTKFFKIGGHQDGSNQISHIVHVSAGGAMKVDASDSSVTFGAIQGTVTIGNSVTISNFPATQAVTFGQASVTFGSVTGSVSVLNFPSTQTVAGTVTANLDINNFNGALTSYVEATSNHNAFPVEIAYQPSVTIGSLPTISGTVTANVPAADFTAGINDWAISTSDPLPVAPFGDTMPISGTVTVASDKGSVSEASTQSITTGGTHQQVFASNSSRKYLLIQNISDTDMYLGLGFNPSNTTPAGLLLAKSGGGIVFESSYIPTSEVRIVCATTGKRFVALQG